MAESSMIEVVIPWNLLEKAHLHIGTKVVWRKLRFDPEGGFYILWNRIRWQVYFDVVTSQYVAEGFAPADIDI